MLGKRNRDAPTRSAEPAPFAARAKDLGALRDAVVDAASVGTGLWLSYLFVLFYFAIAAGAVTHRDLLLENPVKLPFLNVELPLKAFFILGPLVFLVVHAYVLLHFVLLAGKIGVFDAELAAQIPGEEARARLRRQLPSNIFVQSLAGPRDVRTGVIGFLLRRVVEISLVAGPIALLVLFQLQFLPYHSEPITMWQRAAVVIDLILLWLLWPVIARGGAGRLGWRDFKRGQVLGWVAVSTFPVLLVTTIATFPGEWLEESLPSLRFVPTGWPPWRSGRASLHELLVAGEPDLVAQRPSSLWSNVLVLPNFTMGDRVKLDADGRVSIASDSISLRGRFLEGAVFTNAHFRKADFTGARLRRANLLGADLRESTFGCDSAGEETRCAQLQGADLRAAQLQGASLGGAQLQGATLVLAELQGAELEIAGLQGAALAGAQLQGASLDNAQLQGAALDDAQLQGASLHGALLEGADLRHVFVWRTSAPDRKDANDAFVYAPEPRPKYSRLDCPTAAECDWSEASFAALKSVVEKSVRSDEARARALRQIAKLEKPPYLPEEASAKAWADLAEKSSRAAGAYPDKLARSLIDTGCAEDGGRDVIRGLIKQLTPLGGRRNPLEPEVVAAFPVAAAAFLREAKCPGAHGLSEEDRVRLQQIRGWAPKLREAGTATK